MIKKLDLYVCIFTAFLSSQSMALDIRNCPSGTMVGITVDKSMGPYGTGLVIAQTAFDTETRRFGNSVANFNADTLDVQNFQVSLKLNAGNPSTGVKTVVIGSVDVKDLSQIADNTCLKINLNQDLIIREKVESRNTDCGFFPSRMCRKKFIFVEIATSDDINWVRSISFDIK